jgi:hypothetical protein
VAEGTAGVASSIRAPCGRSGEVGAPGGDATDDLGDAALVEVVVQGELILGFAGDGVFDVDLLVAGGRRGTAARFTGGGHTRVSGKKVEKSGVSMVCITCIVVDR